MKLAVVVSVFLMSLGLSAQESTHDILFKDTPLSEVLSTLEQKFEVKFAYNTASVAQKEVNLELKGGTLSLILSEIEKSQKVSFERVDARYYILKKSTFNICGYLKEQVQKLPIEGASIANNTKQTGTITNTDGFFNLDNNKDTDTITISHLGYKTIRIPVKEFQETKCKTYVLYSQNYQLSQIVIYDYLGSGMSKTRDGSIKIKPNGLDVLTGLSEPDVLQSVQLLPGIESPNETAAGLFIRGSTPDQNLVLYDGIKLYNSDHFFGTFSAINPYVTESVTVYRSGVKPEYGGIISGVIDIKTDSAIPDKVTGAAGLNMTHLDAYIKTPISKKIGMILSARRSITDILETPTFQKFSNKVYQNVNIQQDQNNFTPDPNFDGQESFYFVDATLKFLAEISEKDKLDISTLFTKNKLDYAFKAIDLDNPFIDAFSTQNFGANGSWARPWNDRFSSLVSISYSEFDLKYEGKNSFVFTDDDVVKTNSIDEFEGSIRTDWDISDFVRFTNGYQFTSSQVNYNIQDATFFGQNDQNEVHALYSQLSYNDLENWYLDAGLRVNSHSTVKRTFVEPRLFIERALGDYFRISGSGEIKNQSISQIIEFNTIAFGLNNKLWIAAKEDIPVLNSNQFTVGLSYSKDKWNVDIGAYHKRIKGLTSLTSGFETTTADFSQGKSKIYGADLLVKKRIDAYSVWLGYAYATTDFIFDTLNDGKAFKGNSDVTHSLTLSQFYKWSNFQFSLGWKFRTGLPYTPAIGVGGEPGSQVIVFDKINSTNLPAYHRLDFSTTYEFKLSQSNPSLIGKLGISMLNIYDRQNILSRRFASTSTIDNNGDEVLEIIEINDTSLGLTPNLFFRIKF